MRPTPFLEKFRDSGGLAESNYSRIEFGESGWYLLREGGGLTGIEADWCVGSCKVKRSEEFEYLHDTAADPCIGVQERTRTYRTCDSAVGLSDHENVGSG